ncbi:unnamed protein product [Heligmosomoides polygyrus]|uniref:SH2 domain-containing protein n=1 Tax=Heligmosomoides polygyrus TaxID=6339 RepID=A0A183GW84_HELPZ|nr:unnamed protein product [Heligmosomoides polygyrus]
MEQIKTLKDLRTREIAEQKAAEALGLASTRTYEADSLELTYGGFGKRNKKDAVIKMDRDFEMSLANLEKEEWYHGCLPYEDIVGLLKADGDFLVRGLDAQGDRNAMACVTVKYKGKVMDFPVHYVHHKHSHMYTIDGQNKQATIMGIVM